MGLQAGVWNFDSAPVDCTVLTGMAQSAPGYAASGEVIWRDVSIAMLYRPIHSTPESCLECQPYVTSDKKLITWDGRLDNREELIKELSYETGGDLTDIALAAAAVERWGIGAFKKLIGDWAISIWDAARSELLLARDSVGCRPLFYYFSAQRVMWCTYLSSLIFCGDRFTLCDEYVAEYLAFYPSLHLTPYHEIKAVPPGCILAIRNCSIVKYNYCALLAGPKIRYKSDAEYEEHFRWLFRQAVRRRLRCNGPVLAELSGGVDSSSIVCMADDVLRKGEIKETRLATVSFFDSRVPAADERKYIALVEQKCEIKGRHFGPDEYGDDYFCLSAPELATVPGPSQHSEGIRKQFYLLLEKESYKAILSGIGGDESLGAISTLQAQLADLILLLQPLKLAKQLAAWSKNRKRHWLPLLLQAAFLLLPEWVRALRPKQEDVEPWINVNFAVTHRLSRKKQGIQGACGFWLPTRREFAQNLDAVRRQIAYIQTQGFQSAAERRYPFLDLDLLRFLSAIPADQLFRPGQRRSLLRRALSCMVPQEVLFRKTKGGGSPAFMVSFQQYSAELKAVVQSSVSSQRGYFDQPRLIESLNAASNGDTKTLYLLPKTIYLELWLRRLVERGIVNLKSKS
jgi:asparagine synthase (glutamine-hydrolysing)